MPDEPSTSGTYAPTIYQHRKDTGPRFQQPVLSVVLEYVRLGSFQLATIGGAAAFAKTVVAPLERVKIIQQTQPMLTVSRNIITSNKLQAQSDSAWSTIQGILKLQGWKGLYQGHAANVLRVVPEVMLKFSVNDQLKVIFASTADNHQMSFGGKLSAGFATGVLRTTLFHPLSVVRTRLTADMGTATAKRYYTGIGNCIRHTFTNQGVRGFYGGFGLSVAYSGPYLAICFAMYDSLQELLPSDKKSHQLWWYPVAKISIGAVAGVCAATATYPLDTLRRRMEVNFAGNRTNLDSMASVKYRSTYECLTSMVKNEGVASLYRGCFVNCLKTAPAIALQFVAYDSIKTLLMAIDPSTAASSNL